MDALQKIGQLIRDPNVTIDATAFLFALVVSVIASVAISILYSIFYENRATGAQIHRSFIVLGPSITALFIAIQYSIPLSLGLLGALSIIRFRTPIKEPEEVGFIMFLCASAVVTATFQFLLLVALITIVAIALLIRRLTGWGYRSKREDGIILVSFVEDESHAPFQEVSEKLQKALYRSKLESVSAADGIATIHTSFCDLSADTLLALRSGLQEVDGIRSINVYFNKSTQAS